MNNVWEEQNMSEQLSVFHEKLVSNMDLPQWIKMECPYCHQILPWRSIRTVGFKLNARNVGDVVVEFCCDNCHRMNTLYFRQEIENISDFLALMSGKTTPKNEPLIEENMYLAKYNNLVEKMVLRSQGDTDGDIEKRG